MTSDRTKGIAGAVLAKARLIDQRITATAETIQAWAECFGNAELWPTEALAAVAEHYSRANPYPLMPGDVIEYCRAQPVWSSADHAAQFLEKWSDYPFSEAIAAWSGITPPIETLPTDMTAADERAFHATHLRKWVAKNRDVLIGAILSRRYVPQEYT